MHIRACDSIYSYFNMFSLTYGASPAVYYDYYYYYPVTFAKTSETIQTSVVKNKLYNNSYHYIPCSDIFQKLN